MQRDDYVVSAEKIKYNGALAWKEELFKVIPQYCIAHPYCARFRGISTRKLARARTDNERNFPQA